MVAELLFAHKHVLPTPSVQVFMSGIAMAPPVVSSAATHLEAKLQQKDLEQHSTI
jgi:hypothetical protein